MRLRRQFSESSLPPVDWTRARPFLWPALGLVGAFTVGYLIAALFIFPSPLFSGSAAVPRLIGLPETDARERLAAQQFLVGAVTSTPHHAAPEGTVIWQDPAPHTTMSPGAAVNLLVSDGAPSVPVPDVTELDLDLAAKMLRAAGLRLQFVDSVQAPSPTGVVVTSRPDPGVRVSRETGVILTVSRGEPIIEVPNVLGLALGDAMALIEEAGLSLGSSWSRPDTTGPPGTVVEQLPAAGTLAAPGQAVDLVFAESETP